MQHLRRLQLLELSDCEAAPARLRRRFQIPRGDVSHILENETKAMCRIRRCAERVRPRPIPAAIGRARGLVWRRLQGSRMLRLVEGGVPEKLEGSGRSLRLPLRYENTGPRRLPGTAG